MDKPTGLKPDPEGIDPPNRKGLHKGASLCEKSKNWSSNSNMLWRCSSSTPTYRRASEFLHSLERFCNDPSPDGFSRA